VLFYAARGQDLSVILPNLGVMALAGYRLLPAAQLLYGQFTQIGTTLHALDEVYDEFLLAEQDRDLDPGMIHPNLRRLMALQFLDEWSDQT
jgi:hypothetical protein